MSLKRLKAGAHNCYGHLSLGEAADASDTETVLERPALLVYEGQFNSQDGPVDVTNDDLDRLVENHNAKLSKMKNLIAGAVSSLRFCPPVQLDHSTLAAQTVGRVVGELVRGNYVDEETGDNLSGVFGRIRILGRENVEKARDGRFIHVSVGADFAKGVLNELSITPFPAAARAAMLKDGNANPPGDPKMTLIDRLKKYFKLSEDKDAEAKQERMKNFLTAEKKMSDDDAVKEMASMDDEKVKALSEEIDAHEQKLASDKKADEERLAKEAEEKAANLAAATAATEKAAKLTADQKEGFVKLAKSLKSAQEGVRLAQRQINISSRLAKFRSDAKITPAEEKKIDIVKLSKENDATIEQVMKSYQDREPVIMAGVFGSSKAENVAQLSARLQKEKIELETRLNMPSKRAAALKAISEKNEQIKRLQEGQPPVEASAPAAGNTLAQYNEAYGQICQMIDGGQGEGAKAALKKLMESLLAPGGAPQETGMAPNEAQMSGLAENVKTMHNQLDELIKLVGPNMGVAASEI